MYRVLRILFFTGAMVLPSLARDRGKVNFYERCSIDIEPGPHRRFSVIFRLDGLLPEKTIGEKKKYYAEILDETLDLALIEARARDQNPVWRAVFSNEFLYSFVEFRRREKDPYTAGKFKRRFEFFENRLEGAAHRLNGKVFEERYRYDPRGEKLDSIHFSIDGYLREIHRFIYRQGELARVEYHRPARRGDAPALATYETIRSLFRDPPFSVREVKRFDSLGREIDSQTLYYSNDLLIRSVSDRLAVTHRYRKSDFDPSVFRHETASPGKVNTLWFSYQKKERADEFLLEPRLRKILFSKHRFVDEENRSLQTDLNRFASDGSLQEKLSLGHGKNSVRSATKRQAPGLVYRLIFDNRERLKEKIISDGRQRLLGRYRYTYEANGLIRSRRFFDSGDRLLRISEYTYVSGGKPTLPSSLLPFINHHWKGNFFLGDLGLELDLLTRTFDIENAYFKETEKADAYRLELVNHLLLTRQVGLEKITVYDAFKRPTSHTFIRSSSDADRRRLKFEILRYDPISKAEPRKHNEKMNARSLSAPVSLDREDGELRRPEGLLKERLELELVEGRVIFLHKQKRSATGALVEEIGFSPLGTPYVRKGPLRDDGITDHYIRILSPANPGK